MAGVREKLLTASDLAALCEVDLKTIHNWVDRGRIAHFRTPGRHLRFRAPDVAEFLRAWGYAVPRELAKASSRSVLVIGTKDTLNWVAKAAGEGMPLRHAPHPYDALVFAGAEPADVYIADAKAVANDIDVLAMAEALHRASPQALIVVLSDDTGTIPAFISRVGRSDVSALRGLLLPAEAPGVVESAPITTPTAEEAPRGIAASGASR